MTDKEILIKAIDKTMANGWVLKHPVHTNASISDFIMQMFDSIDEYPYMQFEHMAGIIFSHSFAKAFFVNDPYWHLQQMVLEENPIKYLEKFL